MNDNQIEKAIASVCGITNDDLCLVCCKHKDDSKHIEYGPDLENSAKHYFEGAHVPHYTSNLVAMAEAEETLSDEQLKVMQGHLEECGCWPIWRASARQRAVAFLKTVGKWENENVEKG